MEQTMIRITAVSALGLAACAFLSSPASSPQPAAPKAEDAMRELDTVLDVTPAERRQYLEAIRKTAAMVGDREAHRLVQRHGLNLLNLTWEDTGRYKGSSVGPNISDMTIQVAVEDPRSKKLDVTLMPVIRFPNFSDLTCDLDPMDFTLLVGNHRGRALKRVSLHDFLENPTRFMSFPDSWPVKNRTLLAPRDEAVLVSAQACFLPVPKSGKATFNPVLFNYQSVRNDPAVLTILATREGTSMTVIDNHRDAFNTGWNWGQRLFHNQDGMRASLTGQRLSEFKAGGSPRPEGVKVADGALNMVLLIQVPLKQRYARRDSYGLASASPPVANSMESAKSRRSDVEAAVIGHGDLEGPFTEIDGLSIERDPRFPVRVTVQFYKATSNGVVSEADISEIKRDIGRVYAKSDFVGSLVTAGETGRITEYDGVKVQPPDWWERFWERYESDNGISRWEARMRLYHLLGAGFESRPTSAHYLRCALREAEKKAGIGH